MFAGQKGYNVSTKRMEVMKDPEVRTTKNGKKQLVGTGSDGTKIYKFIKC